MAPRSTSGRCSSSSSIPRGIIRAADGTRLATNTRTGSGQTRVYKRRYPQGSVFAHAVGYSYIEAGDAGLERYYNDELAGNKDEFGSLLDQVLGERKEGQDLRTTLDPRGQKAALSALQGRNGSVVALEPSTGKVLVMANVPSYDPNGVVEQQKQGESQGSGRFDRATQARYPPGSTFKVVTAAAALDTGKYTPDSLVDGKNNKKISGVPLQNSGGEDFPTISLTEALTNSVNTVWAEVAVKLGPDTMYRYMRRFGFNQKPPIDLPGDELTASGVYSAKGRLLDDEDPVDIGRVGIGQERLQVTPLQMAMVASAVANGGSLMKPHLADRFIRPDGRAREPLPRAGEVSGDERRDSVAADRHDGPGGQGGNRHRRPRSRASTSRARPALPRWQNATSNQAWFIAFAPKDDPKVAIAVTVERTQGQGGTVAAPIAKQVMEALIGAQARWLRSPTRRSSTAVTGSSAGSGPAGWPTSTSADDTHLGREVALKVLHRRFSQDEEFVERFRREASAAAGLQHPNVVGVFDRGSHDGTWYIAMERLRGRTLKQVVQEDAPLDQRRTIDLVSQVLVAAGFAHRRGVIHRDFKPHNVIVGDDDSVKVTDFGIARAGASEMTETGSIMGTAQYLSPEQAQGQRVDARSDLYSIGIILFELLTGRVPFTGESAVSIALKHVSEPAPPVSHFRPDVHPALEAIVARALVKDPGGRFQSAEEFVLALDDARRAIASGKPGQHTTGFAPVGPPPVAPVNGDWPGDDEDEERRRGKWPLIALALLALALGGYAIFKATTKVDQVEVPRVTGLDVERASARLERKGFKVATRELRNKKEPGIVLGSDPAAGQVGGQGVDRHA